MPDPEPRRHLPSVDSLLRTPGARLASGELGRPLLKAAIREAVGSARAAASDGSPPPSDADLLRRAIASAQRISAGLTPVINATGVVLHTGLGRAPLPEGAADAAARAANAYVDLEVNRDTGSRGRRTSQAEFLLRAITGAEAALVVNNNAAALVLTLAALARRREVLVSRGELIEIGGEFRLPDIMAASGARLIEVGTTNRTRLSDYAREVTDKTALILKVHPSNYTVIGFTATPSVRELADLAHGANVPLVHDLGSGLLERYRGVPAGEPALDESLKQGTDLACFSGDKLLGGPQAGILLGRADLIERLRRNPLARAVRVDKMQVAALGWVLSEYSRGAHLDLPTWRMLREPLAKVKRRAQRLGVLIAGDSDLVRTAAAVGGGSLPGYEIDSYAVRVAATKPERLAAELRAGTPPVFCRTTDGAILLDCRTVGEEQLSALAGAIAATGRG